MDKEIKQIEQYIEEIVGLMEDTADNTRLIEEIQSEVKDLKESTTKDSDFKAEIENIKDLIAKVKTIKGEDGKDGKDGVDGKDGKNGVDGKDGESIKGEDGKDGTDGKDGSPDSPKDIKEKLESLKKDKRLDVSAIKGIEDAIKENQTDWSDAINRVMLVAAEGGRSGGGGTGTVTGTGSTGQVTYWDGISSLTGDADFTFDGTDLTLGSNLIFPAITAGATTGVIYKGSTPFIHTYQGATSSACKNIFIGLSSGNFTLNSATSLASNNIGLGENSLQSLTTGYQNTGIGTDALKNLTTGKDNYALGYRANRFGNGDANVFVGTTSGPNITSSPVPTANYNIGIGTSTLIKLTTGYYNTAIGSATGSDITTGNINVLIGEGAGSGLTTGSSNIAIGAEVLVGTATGDNQMNIGDTIYGKIYAGGGQKIGIGVTVANITARLHLPAGTTAAATAPLKFTSGSLMTASEAGAIEFLTDSLYATITTGAARKEIVLADATLTSGRVPYVTTNGRLIDDVDLKFNGTTLELGVPTTAITDSDFVLGVSSNTRAGLAIQTKAGTTLPAFKIQNSAGVVKASFDTTGNGAFRVNYSGTMVAAANPGYVLSVQNIGDSGEGSWIEILNSGGYNKGAFFGMYGDQFQLYNWQGGDIEFNTFPTASDSRVRYTITDVGNFGFSALSEYAWGSGWGGGVGVIGIANATTAPTTSLSTTALALYSVSQELYFMSSSNTVRKVATLDKTETFTNKRITKRVGTTASSATPTPNADTDDIYTVTALAAAATFGAPTGTPTNGQSLLIRIKDNGTARTLAYNAIYRAIGVTLPTTTVISKTLYLGLKYNSADSKWDVLAVGQEA